MSRRPSRHDPNAPTWRPPHELLRQPRSVLQLRDLYGLCRDSESEARADKSFAINLEEVFYRDRAKVPNFTIGRHDIEILGFAMQLGRERVGDGIGNFAGCLAARGIDRELNGPDIPGGGFVCRNWQCIDSVLVEKDHHMVGASNIGRWAS